MYSCASCGLGVAVSGPVIIRACRCGEDTPVLANLAATVKGRASVSTEPTVSEATRTLARAILRKLGVV